MKKFPDITIKAIDHSKQRYDTVGDYFPKTKKDVWHIRVSKITPDVEFLVAMHELVELYLTLKRGIKETDIMAFDLKNIDHPDPGRLKSAPYHREHMFALRVERLLCKELGLIFEKTEKMYDTLVYKPKRKKHVRKG